jgi:hypothetical protein
MSLAEGKQMAKEKVRLNVRLLINEYDKFVFTETTATTEKTEKTVEKPKLVVPYAFPLSTSPNYCW